MQNTDCHRVSCGKAQTTTFNLVDLVRRQGEEITQSLNRARLNEAQRYETSLIA
jgi:hypothetical protein